GRGATGGGVCWGVGGEAEEGWGFRRGVGPGAARLAVFETPANTTNAETTLRDVAPAAHAMGLQIQILKASTGGEIEAAFATFVRERPDAPFVGNDAFLTSPRVQFSLLAAFHPLPPTYLGRESSDGGGAVGSS